MNLVAALGAKVLDLLRGWGRASLFFVDLLRALPPAVPSARRARGRRR